jgi:glucose/arabinose dehydrogenase
MLRRASLLTALALAASAAPSVAQETGYYARRLAAGLNRPTAVAQPPGETELLFVAEQDGMIRAIRPDGSIHPAAFMNLTAKVSQGGLHGLVSLLFHPDYLTNGWVYVFYSATPTVARIERYTVPNPSNHFVDLASALTVFEYSDPISFHMGSGMDFGIDGKLYVGIGDSRVELPGPGCTSQSPTSLMGKLLRLEPDGSIPPDNPYVGVAGIRDEIFAWGLRQPYRVTSDPANGDLYIGDVGESAWEEVSVMNIAEPTPPNFGWRALEADMCAATTECASLGCTVSTYRAPAVAYDHTVGCSVIGGYVYRGQAMPEVRGTYFFADWCTMRVWSMRWNGTAATDVTEITSAITPFDGSSVDMITSFGFDSRGEILIVDGFPPGQPPNSGEIYRLEPKPLRTDESTVSLGSGGTQNLYLTTASYVAGRLWWMFGSASGTSPGLAGPPQVPLNFDDYLLFTITTPNAIVNPSVGVLDAQGKAATSIVIPPGALNPSFAGLQLNHAFIVFDDDFNALGVSNAASLTFSL